MRIKALAGALLLTAFLFLPGCGDALTNLMNQAKENTDAASTKTETPPLPVGVTHPERRSMAAYLEPVGWIQAERRVDVLSKGMGQCLSVAVEEGDRVTEGQVLAELDRKELEAQIKQSSVNTAQTKYDLEVAKKEAEAGSFADHQAKLKQFMWEQAEAGLELQRIQLEHQTIRTPINGIVTARRLQKGMMVSAGTPSFSVVDPASCQLPIEVPERQLPNLKVGQDAQVRIDSQGGTEYTGKVLRINPNVDVQKGTVKVMLDFRPEDKAQLREGAFARVRLVTETHENALVVPKDALLEENARSYVMIVRSETADEVATRIKRLEEDRTAAQKKADKGKTTPVKITDEEKAPHMVAARIEIQKGLEDSNYVEALSGLEENAQVVILGQNTLKPGAAVKITDASSELRTQEEKAKQEATRKEGEAASGKP